MSFSLSYAKAFDRKSLMRIGKVDRENIYTAIHTKLLHLPNVFGKPLRNSRRGYWSLRVGKYRIIYRIEDSIVRIFDIGHRSKIYEE